MGKAEREYLNSTLNSHLNTIHETLQLLNHTPPSSLKKVSWNDVTQMAEQISKQATVVGILWTGETPEVAKLEENMVGYFNSLQGFVLFSHGSTVGAGPTLSLNIHTAVKQVVDCSFMLWKECVASYGSRSKDRKLTIPQLVGSIWEACSAIKKTPSTNVTAIGRAVTQVAISVKDVLREMKELKPSTDPTDEATTEASDMPCDNNSDGDDDDDIDTELSPEEMKIAQSAIAVLSETLALIKELIRSITGLNKQESLQNNTSVVDSLERLLKLCQEIGVQIDELGACLYPPQEALAIKTALEKIGANIDKMQVEIENIQVSLEAFVQACINLRSSLRQLENELSSSCTDDLVPKIHNLAVSS